MSNRYAEQDFDRRYGAEASPRRFDQCRLDCTADCGHCKGNPPLSEREAEILKVACASYHVKGLLEHVVVTRLKMSVTTFWQIVNELIDTQRGIAFDPVNVNRLRRQRDAALKLRRP